MLINTLKSQKSYKPWEHLVLDSFYDSSLFNAMQQELTLVFSKLMYNRDIIFINDISKLPATSACIAYKPVDENYLAIFDKHRNYKSLKVKNQVILCNGNVDYRIHDEREDKILSAVTYIHPEIALGTRLYNKDKSFCCDVEWKPNRMLLFCGETDVTWHSYHATSERITLHTFLEDDA